MMPATPSRRSTILLLLFYIAAFILTLVNIIKTFEYQDFRLLLRILTLFLWIYLIISKITLLRKLKSGEELPN